MRTTDKVTERLFQVLSEDEKAYLKQSGNQIQEDYKKHFVRIFSTLNRRLSFDTRESIINFTKQESKELLIINWTILRLSRVWLLGQIQDEQAEYVKFINKLFEFADMHELEALYSALPILNYPQAWIDRCQEGIRNNIGLVQSAVIEHNTFPSTYLEEESWNQLVLKAFFTGRNILNIHGLFERNNESLAHSIVDYIYERHSAKRELHPMLWVLAKDNLPPRAIDILVSSYQQEEDKVKKDILLRVLADNREHLNQSVLNAYKKELEEISPIDVVLEAYRY